jgi:hypothetical protein
MTSGSFCDLENSFLSSRFRRQKNSRAVHPGACFLKEVIRPENHCKFKNIKFM